MPTVSVVIVNWNGAQHLEPCLRSLQQLDFPRADFEVLMVDNHSSDGSIEQAKALYPGIRILANARNQGFARPNNQAAAAATGEYLALLNNDMRVDPGWLREALAQIDRASGTVCIGSKILDWEGQQIDYAGGSLHYLGYADQNYLGAAAGAVSLEPQEILFPCGGAMLIDRQVYRELGGFDEDYFAIFEDVDLGWRLWLAGYRVRLAPASITYHRRHGSFAEVDPRVNTIVHRNALMTIFKNYGEEAFRKIVPLAFVLAVRRAVSFSGVNRSAYELWDNVERHARDPERRGAVIEQCQLALNHIVALDQFLDQIPLLSEKRRRVQALRRRDDAEILGRFGDPFRCVLDAVAYEGDERRWVEALGLERLFGASWERRNAKRWRGGAWFYRRDLREHIHRLETYLGELEATARRLNRYIEQRIERELGAQKQLGELPNFHRPKGIRYYLARFGFYLLRGEYKQAVRKAWDLLSGKPKRA